MDPADQGAGERTGPRASGSGEVSLRLKYGGRAAKKGRRRVTEAPRTDALGLSIGESGEWLPNFDGEFELIEDDELK